MTDQQRDIEMVLTSWAQTIISHYCCRSCVRYDTTGGAIGWCEHTMVETDVTAPHCEGYVPVEVYRENDRG